MLTVTLTDQNFAETVESGVVVIDFWAEWCGPCRRFAPVFEGAAGRHPDVVFGKVDTEAQQGLAEAFQIQSIPTLVVMRDGIVLGVQPGALPGEALDDIVEQVKALDMGEVRRAVEAQQQGVDPSAADVEAR